MENKKTLTKSATKGGKNPLFVDLKQDMVELQERKNQRGVLKGK